MFKLEITTLHEFRIFVKLIKAEEIDPEEVKELSTSLREATTKLLEAEKGQ